MKKSIVKLIFDNYKNWEKNKNKLKKKENKKNIKYLSLFLNQNDKYKLEKHIPYKYIKYKIKPKNKDKLTNSKFELIKKKFCSVNAIKNKTKLRKLNIGSFFNINKDENKNDIKNIYEYIKKMFLKNEEYFRYHKSVSYYSEFSRKNIFKNSVMIEKSYNEIIDINDNYHYILLNGSILFYWGYKSFDKDIKYEKYLIDENKIIGFEAFLANKLKRLELKKTILHSESFKNNPLLNKYYEFTYKTNENCLILKFEKALVDKIYLNQMENKLKKKIGFLIKIQLFKNIEIQYLLLWAIKIKKRKILSNQLLVKQDQKLNNFIMIIEGNCSIEYLITKQNDILFKKFGLKNLILKNLQKVTLKNKLKFKWNEFWNYYKNKNFKILDIGKNDIYDFKLIQQIDNFSFNNNVIYSNFSWKSNTIVKYYTIEFNELNNIFYEIKNKLISNYEKIYKKEKSIKKDNINYYIWEYMKKIIYVKK